MNIAVKNDFVELPNKFKDFVNGCQNLIEDIRNHKNNREDFQQFEKAFERQNCCAFFDRNDQLRNNYNHFCKVKLLLPRHAILNASIATG